MTYAFTWFRHAALTQWPWRTLLPSLCSSDSSSMAPALHAAECCTIQGSILNSTSLLACQSLELEAVNSWVYWTLDIVLYINRFAKYWSCNLWQTSVNVTHWFTGLHPDDASKRNVTEISVASKWQISTDCVARLACQFACALAYIRLFTVCLKYTGTVTSQTYVL